MLLQYAGTVPLVRYTIGRYIEQHSLPFRRGLTEKRFNGHVARIAEGVKFKFKRARVENHCSRFIQDKLRTARQSF